MKEQSNIVTVVYDLDKSGYTEEFRVIGEKLHWMEKSVKYNADQFEIDYAYCFESPEAPEDTALIYAISIPKRGTKRLRKAFPC